MVNKKQIKELLNESACSHNEQKRAVATSQNLELQAADVLLREPR